MAHVILFYVVLLVACGGALRHGGGPERCVAVTLLAGTAATWLVGIALRGYGAGQFHGVEYGVLAVEALMLAAVTLIACAADRFWPLWMSALQAFGVMAHIAKAVAPDILPDVYLTAHAFSAYPGLLLLTLATRWHRRRLREEGHDRPWSISSPPSIPSWPGTAPTG